MRRRYSPSTSCFHQRWWPVNRGHPAQLPTRTRLRVLVRPILSSWSRTTPSERIISVADLTSGTYQYQADRLHCLLDAEISIPSSPFYIFKIEGAYQRTMARETLVNGDWSILIVTS